MWQCPYLQRKAPHFAEGPPPYYYEECRYFIDIPAGKQQGGKPDGRTDGRGHLQIVSIQYSQKGEKKGGNENRTTDR